MKRCWAMLLVAALVLAVSVTVDAEDIYPDDVMERYLECMERHDLDTIKDLLWTHHNVERIDASIYGLPTDDFDDQANLTINERLTFRELKAENGTEMAISGPLQYPHHLRKSLDATYERTGERPDCTEILAETNIEPLPQTEDLGSGWASDLNITNDASDRGEVDVVIDYANPNRLIASSCPSGYFPDTTSNFIGRSSDWGQTWTKGKVGNNSGTTWECDPVSYYQRSTGNVYHSKIGCSDSWCSNTWAMMRYSTDNGVSWSDCDRMGNLNSEDRQWHVVDNTPTSACYGKIYATWHNSNSQKVSSSTDNCATFGTITNLTTNGQAISPDINVAADGHVFVVWQNQGDGTFKMAGSADCGLTWTSPSPKTVKTRLAQWKNYIPAQCQRGISALPNVDVDRAPNSAFYGRVYMVMFDFDQAGCGTGPGCTNWSSSCDYDIWFTYSDNNGSTFATPVNLTAAEGDKVDHFMGYMRVDEADGSIYIAYHRSRLAPTALADRQKTHYFVKKSTDGGSTWTTFQASSLEGDERNGGANSFERGDYNRLDVKDGVAWPVWIDRRNTTADEEIIVRKLCSEPSHWSERAPTYTAAAVTATPGANQYIDVTWDLPDIYWGDAKENNSARKYQLWVDGALAEDNIHWTYTTTSWQADDCSTPHTFMIRAINQCGMSKDYATDSATATDCCNENPEVDVQPNGSVPGCGGQPILLTAVLTGGVGPFEYQWYQDGSPVGGAINSTYSPANYGVHTYNCKARSTACVDYATDPVATQVDFMLEPSFGGLTVVDNPAADTCTMDLSWSPAVTGCAGPLVYNIYRSTASGFTPAAGNRIMENHSSTSYSDADGLITGTPYYYIVRAKDMSTGIEEPNMIEVSGTPTGAFEVGTWSDNGGDSGAAKMVLETPWTVAASGGNFGPGVYYTGVYGADECASLTTPQMHLNSNSQVNFYSKFDLHDGQDKGEVQVSADGGTTWERVDINYPGYADAGDDACELPAGDVFTGAQTYYALYSGSLATWADQDVMIRWQLSTDPYNNGDGWWIDDVFITNVSVPTDCTTGSGPAPAIFSDGFESGNTSAWTAAVP